MARQVSNDTLYVLANMRIDDDHVRHLFRLYGKILSTKFTNTQRNCALVRMAYSDDVTRIVAAYHRNNNHFPNILQLRKAIAINRDATSAKRERVDDGADTEERAAKAPRTTSWIRVPSAHTPAPPPAQLYFAHKNVAAPTSAVPLYVIEVYSPIGQSEEVMRVDPNTYWQLVKPVLRDAGVDASIAPLSDAPFYMVEARDPDGVVIAKKRADPTVYWTTIKPVLRTIEVDAALMLNGTPPTVLDAPKQTTV